MRSNATLEEIRSRVFEAIEDFDSAMRVPDANINLEHHFTMLLALRDAIMALTEDHGHD